MRAKLKKSFHEDPGNQKSRKKHKRDLLPTRISPQWSQQRTNAVNESEIEEIMTTKPCKNEN